MVSYSSVPAYKTVPHAGPINPWTIKAYTPTLVFWGTAAVFGIMVFTERWPLFQDTFYSKIPILGKRYQKPVDPQDVPV